MIEPELGRSIQSQRISYEYWRSQICAAALSSEPSTAPCMQRTSAVLDAMPQRSMPYTCTAPKSLRMTAINFTSPISQVLHIRNLPYETTHEELEELAAPFGVVQQSKLAVGPNRNQAFIEFESQSIAIAMVQYFASASEPAKVSCSSDHDEPQQTICCTRELSMCAVHRRSVGRPCTCSTQPAMRSSTQPRGMGSRPETSCLYR